MCKPLTDWKATLSPAPSFRRMYALSASIAESDPMSPELKSAARQVVRTLNGVIDLPIADARVLAKARKRYERLRRLVVESGEEQAG